MFSAEAGISDRGRNKPRCLRKVNMEEARAIHQDVSSEPGGPSNADDAMFLEQFIGGEAVSLMGILRSYVLRYQLAHGKEEVQEAAFELLHEVYIKATKSYTRFDKSRPIRAW